MSMNGCAPSPPQLFLFLFLFLFLSSIRTLSIVIIVHYLKIIIFPIDRSIWRHILSVSCSCSSFTLTGGGRLQIFLQEMCCCVLCIFFVCLLWAEEVLDCVYYVLINNCQKAHWINIRGRGIQKGKERVSEWERSRNRASNLPRKRAKRERDKKQEQRVSRKMYKCVGRVVYRLLMSPP